MTWARVMSLMCGGWRTVTEWTWGSSRSWTSQVLLVISTTTASCSVNCCLSHLGKC